MNYKKVLVTGGAGFIGSHTVDLLLKKGYQVKILDNLQKRVHPFGKPKYLPKEAEFIKGDVANRIDLLKSLKGVDAVYHLAAYQDYMPDFSHFIHTNTESTALLFELILAKKLPIKKIVFASSQAVAGDGKWKCPEHREFWAQQRSIEQLEKGEWEVKCPICGKNSTNILMTEDVARPITTYGASKYSIEVLANILGKKYDIPTVCMRYTYVQGPRNSIYNTYSGIARVFAMRILNDKPPMLYEDGMGLRDYINVTDVARANLIALEDERANNEVFFAGGGRGYTGIELANTMLKVFKSNLKPQVPGIFRVGDTRSTVSSIAKLGRLGWKPEVTLEKSLEEYKNWLLEQGTIKDNSDIAFTKMVKNKVIRYARRPIKGILLAGGLGTRLYPVTRILNKHILPLYDRPMFYWPLKTLIDSGIKEIAVVSGPPFGQQVKDLIKYFPKETGIKINYIFQPKPAGMPDAVQKCRKLFEGSNIMVIAGDNYYDSSFKDVVESFDTGAVSFLRQVKDPQRYGVPAYKNKKLLRIDEKPVNPKSNYAVTGPHLFDKNVFEFIDTLKPSARGELEIADLNTIYIKRGELRLIKRNDVWGDTGTFDALYNISLIAKKNAKIK